MTHSLSEKAIKEIDDKGGLEEITEVEIKEILASELMRTGLTPESLELEKRLKPITLDEIDERHIYTGRVHTQTHYGADMYIHKLPKDNDRIIALIESSTLDSLFIDLQYAADIIGRNKGQVIEQDLKRHKSLNNFWKDSVIFTKNFIAALEDRLAIMKGPAKLLGHFLDFTLQTQLNYDEYYETFLPQTATNVLNFSGRQYGLTISYSEFLTKCLGVFIVRALLSDLDQGAPEVIEQFDDEKFYELASFAEKIRIALDKSLGTLSPLNDKIHEYYVNAMKNQDRKLRYLSTIYNSPKWDAKIIVDKNTFKRDVQLSLQAANSEDVAFFKQTRVFKLYEQMLSDEKMDSLDSDIKPFFVMLDKANALCPYEKMVLFDAAYRANFRNASKFKFKGFVEYVMNPENGFSAKLVNDFYAFCHSSADIVPKALTKHFKEAGLILPGERKIVAVPVAKLQPLQTVSGEAVSSEVPKEVPAESNTSRSWFNKKPKKIVDEVKVVKAPRSAYDPLAPKPKAEKGKKKAESSLPEEEQPVPVLPVRVKVADKVVTAETSSSHTVVEVPAIKAILKKPDQKKENKDKAKLLRNFVNQNTIRALRFFLPKDRVKAHSLETGTAFDSSNMSYADALAEPSVVKAEKKRIKGIKDKELPEINEQYAKLSDREYTKWLEAKQSQSDARMWIDFFFDAVSQLKREDANKGTNDATAKFGLTVNLCKIFFNELSRLPAEVLDIYAKKLFDFMVLQHEHNFAPNCWLDALFGSDFHPVRNYIAGRFCEMSGLKEYAEIWYSLTSLELRNAGMKHLELFKIKGEIRERERLNCVAYLIKPESRKLAGLYSAIQMTKTQLHNTDYLQAINLYVVGLIDLLQLACAKWEHAGNNPDLIQLLRLNVDTVMHECRTCVDLLMHEFSYSTTLFVSERQMLMIFKNLSILTDALNLQELKDQVYTHDLLMCDTGTFFSQIGFYARQPAYENDPAAFCEMVQTAMNQRKCVYSG